ncbi:MAG: cyclodeaminase/cyclohydrolase family protein [Planctomycetota bacterium]
MKYIDEPMRKYFEEAASGSETPGGGSIAGIGGALAAAMMSMVCNFTVGKKKYADVEAEIIPMLDAATAHLNNMLHLAVADTKGFEVVARAYGMPKETELEKQSRAQAIQEGCKVALDAPEQIFDTALAILRSLRRLVEIGNKNLISDVGVSAIMALAAAESAAMNVKINLKFIKDEAFNAAKHKKIDAGLAEAKAIESEVKVKVWAIIR